MVFISSVCSKRNISLQFKQKMHADISSFKVVEFIHKIESITYTDTKSIKNAIIREYNVWNLSMTHSQRLMMNKGSQ